LTSKNFFDIIKLPKAIFRKDIIKKMICVSEEAIIRAGKRIRAEKRNSKKDFTNSELSKFTLSNSNLEVPENDIHNKTGLSSIRATGIKGATTVYTK